MKTLRTVFIVFCIITALFLIAVVIAILPYQRPPWNSNDWSKDFHESYEGSEMEVAVALMNQYEDAGVFTSAEYRYNADGIFKKTYSFCVSATKKLPNAIFTVDFNTRKKTVEAVDVRYVEEDIALPTLDPSTVESTEQWMEDLVEQTLDGTVTEIWVHFTARYVNVTEIAKDKDGNRAMYAFQTYEIQRIGNQLVFCLVED